MDIEDIKKKSMLMDMLMDIMAKDGNPRFVAMKVIKDISTRLTEMAVDDNLTDEQLKSLINIVEQFDLMLNEVKEN